MSEGEISISSSGRDRVACMFLLFILRFVFFLLSCCLSWSSTLVARVRVDVSDVIGVGSFLDMRIRVAWLAFPISSAFLATPIIIEPLLCPTLPCPTSPPLSLEHDRAK